MPAIHRKTEIPGPKSRALMERRRQHVARGPFHATPIFLQRAHGAVLEDVDGNRLLDFASGIGVVNVGHTPAPVLEAMREQASRFLHGSFNVTPYEAYVALCEKLNEKAPGDFPKRSFLANSGAEAVENAVKIARAATGRTRVVAFEHAFHGRTYLGMALTYKEKPYKAGFGPLPEVLRVPFPYCYRWEKSSLEAHVAESCFAEFSAAVDPVRADVAAVVIEPVTGEGGFIPAPPAFLASLREYCTTHGIVLIADEIQSGFGRTGTLFASEQLGLVPDLLITAKGLGAGLPISAVTGRAEIMDAPGEGGIGGTFGGNPVACAAALAVFELFEDARLLTNAKRLGEQMAARLAKWHDRFPIVGDARGLGPMRAIELVTERATKTPHPEATKALVRFAYEHGVVTMSAGSHGNVVRILVPLVMTEAELEEGLAVLEAGLMKIH